MSSFQVSLALNTTAPYPHNTVLLWLATLANNTGQFYLPESYACKYLDVEKEGLATIFEFYFTGGYLSTCKFDEENKAYIGSLAIPVPPTEEWVISK